jgi:hypothetical protein
MNTNLSLSLELVYMLEWLLKNEKNLLNKLIKDAIQKGFLQDANRADTEIYIQNPELVYTTILDFIVSLENLLSKNLEETAKTTTAENEILPTLKKIDTEFLESTIITASIQQTRERLNQNNKEIETKQPVDAKRLLLENIIKNWSPSKNEIMN